MKISRLYLLVGLVFCVVFAKAQNEKEGYGRMMFSFGLGYSNMDELNSMLRVGGYPELKNEAFDFGVLLMGNEGRWYYIYEFGFQSQIAKAATSTTYYAGDIKLSFGYDLLKVDRFSLVPYVGLGVDYGYLQLTQSEDPPINSVAGYIAAASYTQRMDAWGIVAATGVYALWDFPLKKDGGKFTIGMHAGYSPRLIKQQWKSSGGEKLEGLSIPGGVSASVLVGVSL